MERRRSSFNDLAVLEAELDFAEAELAPLGGHTRVRRQSTGNSRLMSLVVTQEEELPAVLRSRSKSSVGRVVENLAMKQKGRRSRTALLATLYLPENGNSGFGLRKTTTSAVIRTSNFAMKGERGNFKIVDYEEPPGDTVVRGWRNSIAKRKFKCHVWLLGRRSGLKYIAMNADFSAVILKNANDENPGERLRMKALGECVVDFSEEHHLHTPSNYTCKRSLGPKDQEACFIVNAKSGRCMLSGEAESAEEAGEIAEALNNIIHVFNKWPWKLHIN